MAWNNGDVIKLVNSIRNKDLNSNDYTSDEWSVTLTANSQKLFSKLLGVPDLYQIDAPVERRGAEISRAVSKRLRPFYIRETVGVVAGIVDLSGKDIGYLLAVEPTTISGRGFDELEPSEVADRLGDSVVAPTEKDPALEYGSSDTIMVYPSSVSNVVLKYYKYPTDAVVAFTTSPTTLLQSYDSGSSTEMGWEREELIEIAYMCLRDLGANMSRADLAQYAQTMVENE